MLRCGQENRAENERSRDKIALMDEWGENKK